MPAARTPLKLGQNIHRKRVPECCTCIYEQRVYINIYHYESISWGGNQRGKPHCSHTQNTQHECVFFSKTVHPQNPTCRLYLHMHVVPCTVTQMYMYMQLVLGSLNSVNIQLYIMCTERNTKSHMCICIYNVQCTTCTSYAYNVSIVHMHTTYLLYTCMHVHVHGTHTYMYNVHYTCGAYIILSGLYSTCTALFHAQSSPIIEKRSEW